MSSILETMLDEWKKDSIINESVLREELLKTASLHAKYLDYFISFKSKFSAAESVYNKMSWKKRKYFRGEMEQHELKQYGWSQWNGLKPSAAELGQLLEMDSDLNDLREKRDMYKTGVQSAEYILKQIQSRDWALKSSVEYQKWLSGG